MNRLFNPFSLSDSECIYFPSLCLFCANRTQPSFSQVLIRWGKTETGILHFSSSLSPLGITKRWYAYLYFPVGIYCFSNVDGIKSRSAQARSPAQRQRARSGGAAQRSGAEHPAPTQYGGAHHHPPQSPASVRKK
jgi:hypothetical protein